jgi:3-dehydroquinate synthetase
MQLDKKARDGAVRFALPQAIGRMYADGKSWTVAAPEGVVREVLGGQAGSA